MRRLLASTIGIAALVLLATAAAATEHEDFYIRSAQDLVDLCKVSEQDEIRDAAIHFCHGFASGAWQYHLAQANGPKGRRLVCPPDSLTRDQAVAAFVAWSAQHPEHMSEPAVEALFRFLIEKWPCPAATGAAPDKTPGAAGGRPR